MGTFVALLLMGSLIHWDGPVRAVAPKLTVKISGSAAWYTPPLLAAHATDPGGIYAAIPDALPAGGQFAAVRIDASTGEQTPSSLMLGPGSPFQAYSPAPVRAEIHGLHFQRPALHLLSFPAGKGPGIHWVDSATGRMQIVFDENGEHRTLLSIGAVNSGKAAERLARVSTDPSGRWIAALARDPDGWTLHLFSRRQSTVSPQKSLEEL